MSNILDVAKAAEAKKTKLEKFLALESLANRKAAPPPPPGEPPPPKKEKRSKKSQIINMGCVPPLPVGILPARPKDGQLPKPEPDRALNLVLALKPAPVPEAKRVGVIKPMEVDTDGVENSNPSTSEGSGLNSSRPSGGAASSSGHVKGDGKIKGGSKTGHWTSMGQTDLEQVEGECTLLSVKDESESRIARNKAREEAVIACADSSREEVEKALERLALINTPKEKTTKGMGIGKVACTACGTIVKWNLMDNVQVWDVDPSTIPEEELIVVDVHWHWDRFCWECRAKEWGCSVEAAKERILSKGGYSDKKRRRVQEFQDAVENVQEFFEMALPQGIEMGPKQKRQVESIARKSLLKVFGGMRGVIRMSSMADEADMAEQQRLIGLLSKEVDADVRGEIIQGIDALNSKTPRLHQLIVRSIVGLLWPTVPSPGGVGLAG